MNRFTFTATQLAEKKQDFGESTGKHTSGPKGRIESAAFNAGDESPAYLKTGLFRRLQGVAKSHRSAV